MEDRSKKRRLLGFATIFLLSILTFIPGYDKPASLFWDENFHIASAQRYLNGTFFMEPHPPLGKLLIAAGEALLKSNADNSQFIKQEKISEVPPGFSFAGYRLVPVLCAALVAPMLFLALFATTENIAASFLIGLAASLDNALIVHSRGAMLEGPQLLFLTIALLAFFKIWKGGSVSKRPWGVILGIASSLSVLIKINSAPIFLLSCVLLTRHRFRHLASHIFLPALLTYLMIWQVHFFIGTKVEPSLDTNGYFSASTTLREALSRGESWKPQYLLQGIKDSFAFSSRYQDGVPKLNYCKEDENGSYPLLWPLGARTIQYRWDDDAQGTRYLYLVPNPAGWLLAIIGVTCGVVVVGARILKIATPPHVPLILIFLSLYFLSWLAPLSMPRVFYLYHYFVPLLFAWTTSGLIISSLPIFGRTFYYCCSLSIIASFMYFSPLTYHLPLTAAQISARSLLSIWDLRCKNCASLNPFARPIVADTEQKRSDPKWSLSIGDLRSTYIEQSIGSPVQLIDGFQVLTRSKVQFKLDKRYQTLSGEALLPPEHLDSAIEFKIIGDGIELWRSQVLTAERPSAHFTINVSHTAILTFIAKTPQESDAAGTAQWRVLLEKSLAGAK